VSRQLRTLGAGLGYRPQMHDEIARAQDSIDWLELAAEDFLPLSGPRRDLLARLTERFTCVLHCTELSLGSDAPLDLGLLSQIGELAELVDAPWFSDHLCFTTAGGVRLGHLAPVQWTHANATIIARKARLVARVVGRPFLVENIAYHFTVPGDMSEAEFITMVLDLADCHLLLDVTNVHTNATNLGFDPVAFLDSVPLDRLGQMHVAGGSWEEGILLDSHDAPVPNVVWDLVRHVARRTTVPAVLLERDARFPADFTEILDDLQRARAAVASGPLL
jgi:uncharacterized protein